MFQMLYIDCPCSWRPRFQYPASIWFRKRVVSETLAASPALPAAADVFGIGLTITNTIAVLEALVGKQTAFARTPKYRVASKKDKVLGQSTANVWDGFRGLN